MDAFLTTGGLLTLTLALERDDRRWLLAAGAPSSARGAESAQYAAGRRWAAALAATRASASRPSSGRAPRRHVPVALRNIVVSHQWSLVTHGGLNFYIGNSETATGFFHPVPGITPNITGQAEDARRVAERAVGHALTDSETSGYFFGLAWDWIGAHPADAIALFARKLAFVFSAAHIALPHSYPFYAYDAGTVLRFLFVGPWLLVPLGLIGLLRSSGEPASRLFCMGRSCRL